MGVLSGNPKDEPLHYGEVAGAWGYLAATKGFITAYQRFLNHAGDKDLRNLLEDMINHMSKTEAKEIEQMLTANGIVPPPSKAEVPKAELDSIPAGARFTDPEISAAISKNIAEGLVACSTMMGQCIREDFGAMFAQFHTKNAQYALEALRMNKEKGWLIPPPLHTKVPEPAHA
jgi:hypothetical protein